MKQQIFLILTSLLWINLAYSQPVIKVVDSEDSLGVINQIAQYLDYLDVHENVHVSVHFTAQMPDKLLGMTFCLDSTISGSYQVIRVWIDSHLNKAQQKFVLAHEMIHVKQYAKRELIAISNQQVMWKGQKYRYQGATNRQQTPWEYEAYRNDQWLAKQYKPQPEAPLVAEIKNP